MTPGVSSQRRCKGPPILQRVCVYTFGPCEGPNLRWRKRGRVHYDCDGNVSPRGAWPSGCHSTIASSWLAYRSAMLKSSFTVLGCFLVIFLRRSGSLTSFQKVAMTTMSLTLGMEFFFLMNHRVNSRRDSPFFWWIRYRSHSTLGLVNVP